MDVRRHEHTGIQSCPSCAHVSFPLLMPLCRAGVLYHPSAWWCDAELSENSQEQLRALDREAGTTQPGEKSLTVKCATVLSPWGFLSLQQPGQTDTVIFPKRDLTTFQMIQWGLQIRLQWTVNCSLVQTPVHWLWPTRGDFHPSPQNHWFQVNKRVHCLDS